MNIMRIILGNKKKLKIDSIVLEYASFGITFLGCCVFLISSLVAIIQFNNVKSEDSMDGVIYSNDIALENCTVQETCKQNGNSDKDDNNRISSTDGIKVDSVATDEKSSQSRDNTQANDAIRDDESSLQVYDVLDYKSSRKEWEESIMGICWSQVVNRLYSETRLPALGLYSVGYLNEENTAWRIAESLWDSEQRSIVSGVNALIVDAAGNSSGIMRLQTSFGVISSDYIFDHNTYTIKLPESARNKFSLDQYQELERLYGDINKRFREIDALYKAKCPND